MGGEEVRGVGLIGAGAMAQALLHGLLAGGALAPECLAVTNRGDRGRLREAERLGVHATVDKADVCRRSDVLILAVKPKDALEASRQLRPFLDARHLVVSVVAGLRRRGLQAALGDHHRVVRAMPNTGSVIGASATALAREGDPSDVRTAARLLATLGPVELVAEEQLDAVTALSGSGPAYVYLLIEAMIAAGVAEGLPADVARALTLQTALGAARMAVESGAEPAELRRQISSPGGTTLAALQVFEGHELRETVRLAVRRAKERAAEIGATLEAAQG